MKKMKILQLLCFPLYGSGSGTYARKLSEALVAQGHSVAIVAPEKRKVKGVKVYEAKLPFMAAFTGHPEHPNAKLYSNLSGVELDEIQSAFSRAIVAAVEDFEPDVVHVQHTANLLWVANYVKSVFQIHYIATSHNTDVINAILDKRYVALTQDALLRADIITAVSKNTRDRLLKILGKGYPSLTRKTKISPPGVDTKLFPNKGGYSNAEKKYSLEDKDLVMYSGKITSIKGVDYFIKSAKKFPETKFIVVGDGEEIGNMKKLAKDISAKNVLFTGYLGADDRDLIAELYLKAKVVVVPSTVSEGIPLSALEAMSTGTPVVASDIGGIPTAVKNMKNGILVKPKNLSELEGGIRKILDDEVLAKKLGANARKDAVSKFDWKVIAKQMSGYYEVAYKRSQRNKATKRPSFVTEAEYEQSKDLAKKKKKL